MEFTVGAQDLPWSEEEIKGDALDVNPRFIRHRGFHSELLPDNRDVLIYLPPMYFSEPERRFPVFYLHDGQNLFDPRTSHVPRHTWKAHETADRLTGQGIIEPLILVGVANTGIRRMPEYTPSRDFKLGGGEGHLYARLLVEELKPFIDATYRTQQKAESTGLGGSSLGGLISLWTGLQYPRIFGQLAVLSPSLWWNQKSIFANIRSVEPRPRIWLDIGTFEGGRHLRDTSAMDRLLRRKGWSDEDLQYLQAVGGAHNEDAWAARFGDVLRFLFPGRS